MLAKRIIPCLDVREGRVVKGVNFVDIIDAGDPVEAAVEYNRQKADELVFLDITASHEKRDIIYSVVEKTAEKVFIPLTVGGGVRTVTDIRQILLSGADKVSMNTAAVNSPSLIDEGAESFGSQCIVLAVDVKRKSKDEPLWEVYTHGGRTPTGIDAIEWILEGEKRGAGEILLTSMDCDGTKNGYDIELYKTVNEQVKIPVIASGGAGNVDHLHDVLEDGNCDAVLAASIFHFNELTVSDVKKELQKRNVTVRF